MAIFGISELEDAIGCSDLDFVMSSDSLLLYYLYRAMLKFLWPGKFKTFRNSLSFIVIAVMMIVRLDFSFSFRPLHFNSLMWIQILVSVPRLVGIMDECVKNVPGIVADHPTPSAMTIEESIERLMQ